VGMNTRVAKIIRLLLILRISVIFMKSNCKWMMHDGQCGWIVSKAIYSIMTTYLSCTPLYLCVMLYEHGDGVL
jgi:hypothetical protein